MKFHRPLGLALATMLAMIAAVGCLPNQGQKPVEIVTPKNGNSTTADDFQVEIRTAVSPSTVAITINAKAIASSNFTITPNSAGATIKGKIPTADLKPNAYNTLKVTAKDNGGQTLSDEISFVFGQAPGGPGNPPPGGGPVDTTAPTLTVTGPVRGQFVALGANLSVAGKATDNVRVANLYLTVDRQSPTNETTYLNPTDGTFKVEVAFQKAGLHRLKVRAVDAAGNETTHTVSVYAGTAIASGTKVNRGAEVSVSSAGMTKVGNVIEAFINPPALDVDTLAKSFNPVWSGSAGPASATLNITRAGFSRADLDLKTVAGGIDTKARVDDFLLSVKADVKIFFSFSLSGTVSADQVDYAGIALVSKSTGNKAKVAIPSSQLQLTGFLFDIDNFPSALESLASPYLARFIETFSGTIIRTVVAPKLEETINGMTVITTDISILGHTFAVGGDLDALNFQTAGGDIVVNPLVTAKTAANPNAVPIAGYLSTPNSTMPTLGFAQDLAVAVSDDAINQVLFEAYRAGATNLTFEQNININGTLQTLTVALLNAFFGANFSQQAGLTTGLPISIDVKPMLAPVVLVGDAGLATFQAHDTYLEVYVGPQATRKKLFTFRANVEIPLDSLTLNTTTGTVVPKIDPNKAVIEFEVVDQPLIQLLVSAFSQFVPAITKAALPILVDMISKMPLVDFSKLPVGISSVALKADGQYLVAGVNLK